MPPIDRSPPARPTKRQLLLVLALALISVISVQRGSRDVLEPMGQIYYVVDYSDGLIRRGLVGECFRLLFGRADLIKIWQAALIIHKLLAAGIVFGMVLWLRAVIGRAGAFTASRLAAVFAIFAASQFLPTMLALTTYVDCYIFALALAGFYLAATGRPWSAAAIGFAGPFVHEMFVLLWAPLGLMILWRDGLRFWRRPALLVMCTSPILAQAAILLFESPAALQRQLALAPIDPAVRTIMAYQQMGHTIHGDFLVMARLYANNPARAVLSIAFFAVPTLAMLAVALPAMRRDGRLLLVGAALAPLAVLALEFDLSRFVTMTQFTAMCSVLFIAQTGGAHALPLRRPAMLACAGCAALLLSLPIIYGYFDHTLIGAYSLLASLPWVGGWFLSLLGMLGTITH